MIRSATSVAPEAVADHYDELDPFYRALWGEHVHHGYWRTGREPPEVAVEGLVELLAERTGIQPGMQVCDVGCGYGATAALLATRFGCEVTGLTLSPRQAERARERPDPENRLTFLCRDWLRNDLPPAHFDAVVAIESTEHMENKAGALAEMARVLKPDGRFGICAWLAADGVGGWRAAHLLEPICREGRLPSMLTASEMTALAADHFTDLAFVDISRAVRRTWGICARRLLRAVASEGEVRRFLRDGGARNRVFAVTLGRILLAYRLGAMRYGILTGSRRQ